ncbi:amino acid adenylation domain-containing protein [Fulvivirga sp. M361]|uniref:non-ribosomal peptide synthetase n=1 Tax=Fulvivirga sp. M361 TaxID=2594266 RepID=UPI00117B9C58|nr:non-ribosomal peptide synthetase [Fulvivirga sp. M361]TRX53357.1 amino acid adenylation domain-containing protein [Fulvivirga sp. M361]
MKTLVDVIDVRKRLKDVGLSFLESNDSSTFVSYERLYEHALKLLAYFQSRGLKPGSELVLQMDDNETFVTAFWACILGGVVPVPLTLGHNDDRKQKLFNVWSTLQDPYLFISKSDFIKFETFAISHSLESLYSEQKGKTVFIEERDIDQEYGEVHNALPDDIAYIQFSSGSTGNPKGVILTHRNLMVNMAAIAASAQYRPEDVMLSWMPLTHDMGLIGLHLNPLYSGMHQILMPTNLFVRRPALWMDKATEYKVTILGSPNFGYRYLLKHVNLEVQNWDLSTIRLIYNGAEPISEQIGFEFTDNLSAFGLRREAICPVYGLAEASLAVTMSGLSDEITSVHVDRDTLNLGDKVCISLQGDRSLSLVNVGKPIDNCRLRIVDDNDIMATEGIIGHIQISGNSVTSGYYNNEDATNALITKDGWLRTGDLGFKLHGNLYVTGRSKDIFFVNGQNFYPHDIEQLSQEVDGIELNKIVVGGFFNASLAKEEVICFIFHRGSLDKFLPLAQLVKSHVNACAGVEFDHILPVSDIPRTTSGKLQRYKLIERFRKGEFDEVQYALNEMADSTLNAQAVESLEESQNTYEIRLTRICRKVLQRDYISPDEVFADIGINSLKAAEISMLVLKEFGLDLPLNTLYEKTTVTLLAELLESLNKQTYIPIIEVGNKEVYKTSSAQSRLYASWEANKLSVAYNIPIAIRLEGKIELGELDKALKTLIARHSSLRTTFEYHNEPVLRVTDSVSFDLKMSHCNSDELDEVLQQTVKPFDLKMAPLFRAHLFKLDVDTTILFLDFHHIISDGISVFNFIDELFDVYQGNPLKNKSINYQDFAEWECKSIINDRLKRQRKFWQDYLGKYVPLLDLATDYARPAVFDGKGARIPFELDLVTVERLRGLAKNQGCTIHALMFSIYVLTLNRYCRSDEMIIGIPVAGRTHPDLLDVHGMFVNNLPIKASLDSGQTFIQYLHEIQQNLANALEHQDYPYDLLRQQVAQKRDVSRNVLFDTMFNYHNIGFPVVSATDVKVNRHFFDPGFSKFDLSMEIFENDGVLNCGVEYATGLFRKETMQGFVESFKRLIDNILSNTHQVIGEISLLSDDAYQREAAIFNDTQRDYPSQKSIHQLFEEQVIANGTVPALTFRNEVISYRQLNNKANYLATVLVGKGVCSDNIVCVLLPRCPEFIVSILGILKSGGCFLPLDTDQPEERIKHILKDSDCKHVITDTSRLDHMKKILEDIEAPLAQGLINIDTFYHEETDQYQSGTNDSHDIAYVIYTSGTTGGPKGVMVEHKSLVNYIVWAKDHYVRKEQVIFPLYTSVSFDLTITSIFTPLITGNSLLIYEDGNYVLTQKVINDGKVNVIKMTPSHLKQLREMSIPANAKANLKRLIVGGEKLETQLALEIYQLFGEQVEIFNEYGPTEATVGCMIHAYAPNEESQTVAIGRPIANTEVHVLDPNMNPVPQGVLGELFVAGDGLARGYLGREDLTRSMFIPNPFGQGRRMYKTGDLVRKNADGNLEFFGRVDHQLKIDGYRIELSEIEQCLQAFETISAAIATAWENDKGRNMLWAYYQSRTGNVSELELRKFLSGRLPHYMIPTYFVQLAEIPLTKNGKVDYSLLPKTYSICQKQVLPANEIIETMQEIWCDILAVEDLSMTDNFFELGGDSIKAIQIVNRLAEKNIALEVNQILTYQTLVQISEQAKVLHQSNSYDHGRAEGEFPITPMAKWFSELDFVNPHCYNQSLLLDLKENIDFGLLQKALPAAINQHDELRIKYDQPTASLTYQEEGELNLRLELHEVSDKHELLEICQELKHALNLEDGLLFKSALISINGHIDKLFITMHHLVIDGISWRILLEDLVRNYHSLVKGSSIHTPFKTASISQWSRFVRSYGQSEITESEKEYWQSIEKQEFKLKDDINTGPSDWVVANTKKENVTIDQEYTDYLLKQAHSVYQTDVPILLSTALAVTLSKWTGETQIKLELENHGRHFAGIDISRTIGWFTAMYPVNLTIKADSLSENIKTVKEEVRSVPNNGIGYGILKSLGELSPTNLSEVRLNYIGQFDYDLENELFSYADQDHGIETDPRNRMSAKLEFNAMVVRGCLQIEIIYNGKAYLPQTIKQLGNTLKDNLLELLDHIRTERNVHFTPSDFDGADLDQEELEALFE